MRRLTLYKQNKEENSMTHILQLKINVNWVKHLFKKKEKKKKRHLKYFQKFILKA